MQKKILLTLLASFLAMSHAIADVQFNGFASVVSGIDLEDDGNPTGDYGSDTVDNLQDSKVGLQWTANLDGGMRFIGQTVARADKQGGYTLNYEWAYFDINIGKSGKLKFGRLGIPFYKYSDYLDVGYAYHWITPPKSMYSLDFSNLDGIGYQQNFTTGNIDHLVNVVFGRSQIEVNGSEWNQENIIAINYGITAGDHEFYVAYAQSDADIDPASLSGLTALAPAEKDDIEIQGDRGYFYGVGYKGMFGPLTVFAEASQNGIDDSISPDSTGAYIGGAYTMGEFTYHVTYEIDEAEEKSFTSAAANAVAKNIGGRKSAGDSTTITLGVRKDIGISSALKVEVSSYNEDRYQGTTAAPALTQSEQKALLLRVALETMF